MRSTGSLLLACAGVALGQDCDVVYEAPGEQVGGHIAQVYEVAFEQYDVWLGDDFSTDDDISGVVVAATGYCGNGCVDPFLVQDFMGQIWDGIPDEPGSKLVMESESFGFNGVDAWSAEFGESCLPAGDYTFFFAARNDFFVNGNIFFYGMEHESSNGLIWRTGIGGIVDPWLDGETPLAPQVVITGCACGDCLADCDANGELNVLDFVCFQQLFQSGDTNADCDGNGVLNVLDFVCFQQAFQAGC